MKKFLLMGYILLSGTALFAQADSLTSWQTGKAIAQIVAQSTGQENNPVYVLISAIAVIVFPLAWRWSHKKQKSKIAELEKQLKK